jgi:hypothetical protein
MQQICTFKVNGVTHYALQRQHAKGLYESLKIIKGTRNEATTRQDIGEHLEESPEKYARFVAGDVVKC